MEEKYQYYVVSPNVWNDGKYYYLLDHMKQNHCVLMGWDQDTPKGSMFAHLKPGDRIIIAKRENWVFNYYFLGIVSQKPSDEYEGAQRIFLDNFVTLENCDSLLKDWSYASAK